MEKALRIRPDMLRRVTKPTASTRSYCTGFALGASSFLLLRIVILIGTVTLVVRGAADPTAAEFAHRAEQARKSGQVVRAYLLYAQAAARDPQSRKYVVERDALAPAAKLLSKTDVQDTDISADLEAAKREAAEAPHSEPPVEFAKKSDWQADVDLQPVPTLKPKVTKADFDLRGDERTLMQQVATTFGVRAIFDPELQVKTGIHFVIAQADFETAMEALTAATETFVFPVSEKEFFVARNTDEKRLQYEPQVMLTFALPEALDQKDLVEAANAVRTLLNMRTIGWDSTSRTVMVRDRATRARTAYDLLTAVLLPKPEVQLEVQVITADSERSYHYGLALPTSYQLAYFGKPGGFQITPPSFMSSIKFLAFGGGASLFGLGLADSSVFATYSSSYSRILYDATMRVTGNQTATFHVGDQYPVAQSLYTGYAQSTPSIYTPAPQIQLVDLGIVLKMSPHVGGDGNIALDVEAEYKALGNQTFNTVPTILERQFKGSVNLREGEVAVIAGLDSYSQSVTRNGLLGLSQFPGINQVLSENNRDTQTSRTLITIKPVIVRLPVSPAISPQYFLGPQRGRSVLF